MEHFKKLNGIDVTSKIEKKNKMNYLSWAWAWSETKNQYPSATYKILKFENLPYIYDEKTGYMVFTEVTIEEVTHEMWLPVLDLYNKAMKTPTMFDINKSIMRCLTKNLAMFGMGLYIYAGEDMPDSDEKPETTPKQDIPKETTSALSDKQINRLFALGKAASQNEKAIHEWIKKTYNKDSVKDLTKTEYDKVCEALEKAKKTA